MTDKEVHLARWQEEEGTANDFTQRLENIIEQRPLTDIKADERELHTNLRGLDAEYHSSLAKLKEGMKSHFDDIGKPKEFQAAYSKAAAKKSAEIGEQKTVLKKERTHPRQKIVVEPAYAAAAAAAAEEFPFSEAAISDAPPPLPKKEKTRKRVKLVTPPPATPPLAAAAAAAEDEASSGEEAYKTPRKGTPEMNELFSTLVGIGQSLDKSGLSPEELTALRKEFKIINISVPPNTKQVGLVKKFYDHLSHLEKMGVNVNKVRERIGADISHRGRSKERSAGRKPRARSHTVSPDEARKL